MTLRGSLADLPLADLLQIVAMNHKSGRLRLTTAEGEGLLVFRDGRIVYGATNAHRESFGSALLLRGLVTPDQLHQALERKAAASRERRLGSILVEMGAVSEAALSDVLRGQLREVMTEMFGWQRGVVEFDEVDVAPGGEVAVDSQDFVMRDGVSTSGVLLGLVDASKAEHSPQEDFLAGLGWVGEPKDGPEAPAGSAESLAGLIADLKTPSWPGEASLAILRGGARVAARGVLLMRAADGFRGLGQFGVWPDEQARSVRALRIAHRADSLLGDVARSGRPFRGVPDHRPHNLLFFRFLDSDPPAEAVVLPVVVGGEVQLLFYGDNGRTGRPLGDTAALERLLAEIGRAMEAAPPASGPARRDS